MLHVILEIDRMTRRRSDPVSLSHISARLEAEYEALCRAPSDPKARGFFERAADRRAVLLAARLKNTLWLRSGRGEPGFLKQRTPHEREILFAELALRFQREAGRGARARSA
ncbi:MAG: hypothetical protein AAFW46_16530 [Pseudomonadota bacterium]